MYRVLYKFYNDDIVKEVSLLDLSTVKTWIFIMSEKLSFFEVQEINESRN